MTSLTDQLNCARRELAIRQRVYPSWIKTGKMREADANREIEAMAAIVKTLEKMVDLEAVSFEIRGVSRVPESTTRPSDHPTIL